MKKIDKLITALAAVVAFSAIGCIAWRNNVQQNEIEVAMGRLTPTASLSAACQTARYGTFDSVYSRISFAIRNSVIKQNADSTFSNLCP